MYWLEGGNQAKHFIRAFFIHDARSLIQASTAHPIHTRDHERAQATSPVKLGYVISCGIQEKISMHKCTSVCAHSAKMWVRMCAYKYACARVRAARACNFWRVYVIIDKRTDSASYSFA